MNRTRYATWPRNCLLVIAAVIVVGLPACTTTPIRIPERPRAHPGGRIVGVVTGAQQGLIEYAFSSGHRRVFATPDPAQSAFFWGNPPFEYAYLLGTTGRIRLITVTSGGEVRPISPSLRPEVQPTGLPAGDLLLSASCQGKAPVFVLNLRAVDTPREVARGCPAALSPGGSSVAFAPDLVSVWRVPSDGTGQSAPMARLTGRRLLLQLGMRSPRILPRPGMSWGRAGLAVAVEGGGRFACVLLEPSGKVRVIPLGAARPSALAWDPTGRLLAFTENDRTGMALRVFDAVNHRLRLAALALGKGLRGLVWSPKGDALVTLEGADRWLVVTPEGGRVRSIVVPPGSMPTDWTA